MNHTFLLVFGTRPEAIKLAPVCLSLRQRFGPDSVQLLATGQHPDLARLALQDFDLAVDHLLEAPASGGLTRRLAWMLERLAGHLEADGPDASGGAASCSHVVVQGDTSTAFAGALAGFNAGLTVVHVEAGLRTYNLQAPFPEEANRRLIAPLADFCFAPTEAAAANLRAERIPDDRVSVVGNTVVDAIELVRPRFTGNWPSAGDGVRRIAVTLHRREAWGAPLQAICEGLAALCRRRADVELVLPVHPNPEVGDTVRRAFDGVGNARLEDPLGFVAMQSLLSTCTLLVTDSGGLQEEAPSHGVPALVTRQVTERMEAVDAGTAILVGLDAERLVGEIDRLLDNEAERGAMAAGGNPFGDGRAAERIADMLGAGRQVAA